MSSVQTWLGSADGSRSMRSSNNAHAMSSTIPPYRPRSPSASGTESPSQRCCHTGSYTSSATKSATASVNGSLSGQSA